MSALWQTIASTSTVAPASHPASTDSSGWLSLWQAVAQSAQVVAVIIIGLFARNIGREQNQINKRLVELEEYVAVNVVPWSNQQGIVQPGYLYISNLGQRPIVMISYSLNGAEYNTSSTLVAGGKGFLFEVPQVHMTDNTRLTIKVLYEDIHKTRFTSTSQATKTAGGWSITTDRNALA